MKIAIACCALIIVQCSAYAQETIEVSKKVDFGFRIGTNYALPVVGESANEFSVNSGLGVQLGISAERNINRFLTVSMISDLSFHQATISSPTFSNHELYPTALNVAAHVLLRQNDRLTSTYCLFGPTLKADLSRRGASNDFPVDSSFGLDFGIGLDHALKYFRFAPELVYSYGVNNVNNNPALRTVHFHTVSLNLNFI